MKNQLKRLPQIQTCLETREAAALMARCGREDLTNAIQIKLQSGQPGWNAGRLIV